MRILIGLLIALLQPVALAGEIYKCKGPNGEIEFTNTQCADAKTAKHYDNYAPVADDPTHNNPHRRESRGVVQPVAQNAPVRPGPSPREVAADLAAIANEDPRSVLGSAAREARMELEYGSGSVAERQAAYKVEMARLHAAATGIAAPAQQSDSQSVETTRPPRHADATEAPAAPPARLATCRSNVNNQVTCFDTNGVATHGRIDANGNARVGGQRLNRDAAGHLKTDNGVCVRDMYGQCQ